MKLLLLIFEGKKSARKACAEFQGNLLRNVRRLFSKLEALLH